MPRETMTPRERWLAVLRRETPDRVPMDYWTTDEARAKLLKHLGLDNERALFERLHIDRPFTVTPRYVGPAIPADEDVYGIRYVQADYGTGLYREATYHPLARFASVEEIQAEYRWPDPDWWDYAELPEQIAAWQSYPIRGGGSEPFLIYKSLRGMEQAYMDLVLHPEVVHYCLDQLFELAYQNTLRIYEAIPDQVMVTYVAEDMGGQQSLLFSPEQIHEFLIPRMKRMNDLAHQAGAHVFFHSDGNSRRIIPDMIAAGIDVLNPIQWRCKDMEREGLKRDFGGQVIFHGGVDNQYTLAFGTVSEVRQEVIDNLSILGDGGGYIVAPCHNIQAVSPPENIVALYETGYEHGWR